ncbi:MAG: ABC transporter permease [Anaerolineae bacterium]|jgi:NitT/TauT family transport system permease protein
MSLAVDSSPARPESAWAGRLGEALRRFFLHRRWIAFFLVLLAWQVITMRMTSGLFPTPFRVAEAMYNIVATGLFFEHIGDSFLRIGIGFVAAMLLGTAVGVLMGSRRFWEQFFQDVLVVGLSLPGLIYALLSVIIFGLGLTAPVMAILVASYPFIAVNIREGVKAIDKELIDMTRAYRVEQQKVLRQVILPSLMPFIFAAIRVGFTIAWKVSVLTEVFGASSGVGYMMRVDFQLFRIRGIMAWGLLFGGVMLLIEYGILLPAERHFARWRPRMEKVI